MLNLTKALGAQVYLVEFMPTFAWCTSQQLVVEFICSQLDVF